MIEIIDHVKNMLTSCKDIWALRHQGLHEEEGWGRVEGNQQLHSQLNSIKL